MHSKHRNNQKKIKRREQQLKIKEKEVKNGKQLIKGLQRNQEARIKQMKINLDRLNHKSSLLEDEVFKVEGF